MRKSILPATASRVLGRGVRARHGPSRPRRRSSSRTAQDRYRRGWSDGPSLMPRVTRPHEGRADDGSERRLEADDEEQRDLEADHRTRDAEHGSVAGERDGYNTRRRRVGHPCGGAAVVAPARGDRRADRARGASRKYPLTRCRVRVLDSAPFEFHRGDDDHAAPRSRPRHPCRARTRSRPRSRRPRAPRPRAPARRRRPRSPPARSSSGPARCTRRSSAMRPALPDLRHGARAAHGHARRQSRTPSSTDMTRRLLGQRRAHRAARRCRDGRDDLRRGRAARGRRARVRLGRSSRSRRPVVLWGGWPFFERALGVVPHAAAQHVHADRRSAPAVAYRYSVVAVLAPGAASRRRSRRTALRPLYFEAAAVIIDAGAARPGARAARAPQTGERDPRAARARAEDGATASSRTAAKSDVPLDEVQPGDDAARAARREDPGRRRGARGPQRRRRVDDHRRADAGREDAPATASPAAR